MQLAKPEPNRSFRKMLAAESAMTSAMIHRYKSYAPTIKFVWSEIDELILIVEEHIKLSQYFVSNARVYVRDHIESAPG